MFMNVDIALNVLPREGSSLYHQYYKNIASYYNLRSK